MNIEYRAAQAHEMELIYQMGYDVWSGGQELSQYMAGCRSSKKYQSNRWFVLCKKGIVRSAHLIHTFDSWCDRVVLGIGSVATLPEYRRKGYGHAIMEHACADLTGREKANVVFLYSDIGPRFYKPHGFQSLAEKYQTTKNSTLMALMLPSYDASVIEQFHERIPEYF